MNKLVMQDTVNEKVGMHGLRVDRHTPIADNSRLANILSASSSGRWFFLFTHLVMLGAAVVSWYCGGKLVFDLDENAY